MWVDPGDMTPGTRIRTRGPALRSGLRSGQAGVESSAGDRRHWPADP
jgi:hypothetical protein